jgi:hypothetical protein
MKEQESVFSIDKRCRVDNISRAALVRSEPVEKENNFGPEGLT